MGRFSMTTWLIVGLLAAAFLYLFARPMCGCSTKEKAYIATMKSDLRNLVIAQDETFRRDSAYTLRLDSTTFLAGPISHVRMIEATREGWSAEATHDLINGRCVIFVGSVAHPPAVENPRTPTESEPICDAKAKVKR